MILEKFNPPQIPPDTLEFLLPDLHVLQGKPPKVVHDDAPGPSSEQALIAARGIVRLQPKSEETQQEWHNELGRAISTLSALQMVDHGFIDDE
jgi:hypothetical protein